MGEFCDFVLLQAIYVPMINLIFKSEYQIWKILRPLVIKINFMNTVNNNEINLEICLMLCL